MKASLAGIIRELVFVFMQELVEEKAQISRSEKVTKDEEVEWLR